MPITTTREFLRYTFTPDETRDHAREMARQSEVRAATVEEKKSVIAAFTEKITGCDTVISRLARFINSGYEHRMIDCRIVYNQPVKGKKEIWRIDNNDIVRVEDMTALEVKECAQETLPFDAAADQADVTTALDEDIPRA
jgi:hypothetical protein